LSRNQRGDVPRSSPTRRGDDTRRAPRPPLTEADRRAAEVRGRRPPRAPRDPAIEKARIEGRTLETWIDEGSVRAEAAAAARRATTEPPRARRSSPARLDPGVVAEISETAGSRSADLLRRLSSASDALDRERFDEAHRMVAPLVRQFPGVAAVHELAGLASYRSGRWSQAVTELEAARSISPSAALLPVLADCYRALRRWDSVEAIWQEVRAASPAHEIVAEARIVVAGSLADRGDLKAAIKLLSGATRVPKNVREHHLRQWYVLADLYDRAGDTVSAVRWFRALADIDPTYIDVVDRLRALGR
jgi:tetratricopeptide (TPR) repeat protein